LNNNQLIDLPSSIAKLTNLTMIDIEDNLFEDSRYNTSDLDAFREFLLSTAAFPSKTSRLCDKLYNCR